MQIQDTAAVVTGGGSGIGRAMAVALAERGCSVVVADIDAEGGRVDRLKRLVGPAPAAAELARCRPEVAQRAGRWVGRSLAAFGFDLDFAPVVDLDHGRENNALDRRCFGATPRAVLARAGAFLAGLHEAGIAGCIKHFPGLGGAIQDTHHLPSAIERTRPQLERDIAPFRGLAASADALMVGHASYPQWEPSGLPGTLSPAIAGELVRRETAHAGIVFTDDLEMEALGRWGGLPERCERSLAAGCDGLLVCRRIEEVPAVADRLAAPHLTARRTEAAARWADLRRRVARLRERREAAKWSIEEVRIGLERLSETVRAQNGMSSSPAGK